MDLNSYLLMIPATEIWFLKRVQHNQARSGCTIKLPCHPAASLSLRPTVSGCGVRVGLSLPPRLNQVTLKAAAATRRRSCGLPASGGRGGDRRSRRCLARRAIPAVTS